MSSSEPFGLSAASSKRVYSCGPGWLTFHAVRHVAVTAIADVGVPYNVTQQAARESRHPLLGLSVPA